MAYQRKDYYYKKAKKEKKPSRAAYKITQIQKQLKFINKTDTVIDLGSAPGGWLKELSKIVGKKGTVIGIDINALSIEIPQNCVFFLCDIMSSDAKEQIRLRLLTDADVIVSDMAPNLSGITFRDAYKSYELCLTALEICKELLKENGNFLIKTFPGKEFEDFQKQLKEHFEKVKIIRPKATRKTSAEFYVAGLGFKKK